MNWDHLNTIIFIFACIVLGFLVGYLYFSEILIYLNELITIFIQAPRW